MLLYSLAQQIEVKVELLNDALCITHIVSNAILLPVLLWCEGWNSVTSCVRESNWQWLTKLHRYLPSCSTESLCHSLWC